MRIFIWKGNQRFGPFTEEQIQEQIGSGAFSLDDLACPEGGADWKPLHQVLGVNLPPAPPTGVPPTLPTRPQPPVLPAAKAPPSLPVNPAPATAAPPKLPPAAKAPPSLPAAGVPPSLPRQRPSTSNSNLLRAIFLHPVGLTVVLLLVMLIAIGIYFSGGYHSYGYTPAYVPPAQPQDDYRQRLADYQKQQQAYLAAQQKAAADANAQMQANMEKAREEQAEQNQKDTEEKAAIQQRSDHPYDVNVEEQKRQAAAEMKEYAGKGGPIKPAVSIAAPNQNVTIPVNGFAFAPAKGDLERDLVITPDHAHAALIVNQGSGQCVYFDGVPGPVYRSIQRTTLLISEDGQSSAYVGERSDGKLAVVQDGKELGSYGEVPFLQFAPNGHRLGYIGMTEKHAFVYDGTTLVAVAGSYSSEAKSLVFSPDGTRAAFAELHFGPPSGPGHGYGTINPIAQEETADIVVDGKPVGNINYTGFFSDHRNLGVMFTPDSKYWVYAYKNPSQGPANGKLEVVTDPSMPPRPGFSDGVGIDGQDVKLPVLSKTGSHCAYWVAVTKAQYGQASYKVVYDGQEQEAVEAIDSLILSPDGTHFAYIAYRKDPNPDTNARHYVAIEDGKSGNPYDKCENLQFNADGSKLMFTAENNGKQFVVCNGTEYGPYSDLGSPVFSDDGQHFAFVGNTGSSSADDHLFVDGRQGPDYASGPVHFCADGRHVSFVRYGHYGGIDGRAYWDFLAPDGAPQEGIAGGDARMSADGRHIARITQIQHPGGSNTVSLLLDGKEVYDASGLTNFAISKDGAHWAGSIYAPDGQIVIYDGHASPCFGRVDDLEMSPDGLHVAYAGYAAHSSQLYVAIDAAMMPGFDSIVSYPDKVDTGSDYPPARLIKFLPDGSLRFASTQNGVLYRWDVPESGMAKLPTISSVEANHAGLHVLHKLDWGENCKGLALAADGRLYGIVSDSLISVNVDGSDYKVLHKFMGGESDGSGPRNLHASGKGVVGEIDVPGNGQRGIFLYDSSSNKVTMRPFPDTTATGMAIQWVGAAPDGKLTLILSGGNPNFAFDPTAKMEVVQLDETGSVIKQSPPCAVDALRAIFDFDGGSGIYGREGDDLIRLAKDGSGAMVVHHFAGPPNDGTDPGRVIVGPDGALYGILDKGGQSNNGLFYRVDRDGGNYQVLWNSDHQLTMGSRAALFRAEDGNLYFDEGPITRMPVDGTGPQKIDATSFVPFASDATSIYGSANDAICQFQFPNSANTATPTFVMTTSKLTDAAVQEPTSETLTAANDLGSTTPPATNPTGATPASSLQKTSLPATQPPRARLRQKTRRPRHRASSPTRFSRRAPRVTFISPPNSSLMKASSWNSPARWRASTRRRTWWFSTAVGFTRETGMCN